ncbi:MAG TPA: protein-L-isoaspartate(D-aspartate) O-methyltransferase [Geothermobacteraceae bacterium]|nr:protein-L-isoaspartate(D-aspartate) O-methyltransferase [Geothermobacteraceae bacterium]
MNYSIARKRMVEQQLINKGITDQRVIQAMLEIPRHLFVEAGFEQQAYGDFPLPIGHRQTISQPYIVAYMSAAAELTGDEEVLEVGTGSGYQAAVLSRLARKVYTVERIPELARRARRIIDQLHLFNVNIKLSDGTLGWSDRAPFDAILVTAGAPEIPEEYLAQLNPAGGRLIIPVGPRFTQVLTKVVRNGAEFVHQQLLDCRFVPLIGEHGWGDE